MDNHWKKIWGQREVDFGILRGNDRERIFMELKRCSGFDAVGEGLTYETFMEQYRQIKAALGVGVNNIKSVYEVGCGSGANLYLFENDGMVCGGVDYSGKLVECSKWILKSSDIICAEAIDMDVNSQYDAVLSNSVFSYFPNEEYALEVLEKMFQKAVFSIGIIDIHDEEKKDDFYAYRRTVMEDFDERYKNLSKLFFSKSFFQEFAEKNQADILITNSKMNGYWNNEYVFNCFMYKRM